MCESTNLLHIALIHKAKPLGSCTDSVTSCQRELGSRHSLLETCLLESARNRADFTMAVIFDRLLCIDPNDREWTMHLIEHDELSSETLPVQ